MERVSEEASNGEDVLMEVDEIPPESSTVLKSPSPPPLEEPVVFEKNANKVTRMQMSPMYEQAMLRIAATSSVVTCNKQCCLALTEKIRHIESLVCSMAQENQDLERKLLHAHRAIEGFKDRETRYFRTAELMRSYKEQNEKAERLAIMVDELEKKQRKAERLKEIAKEPSLDDSVKYQPQMRQTQRHQQNYFLQKIQRHAGRNVQLSNFQTTHNNNGAIGTNGAARTVSGVRDLGTTDRVLVQRKRSANVLTITPQMVRRCRNYDVVQPILPSTSAPQAPQHAHSSPLAQTNTNGVVRVANIVVGESVSVPVLPRTNCGHAKIVAVKEDKAVMLPTCPLAIEKGRNSENFKLEISSSRKDFNESFQFCGNLRYNFAPAENAKYNLQLFVRVESMALQTGLAGYMKQNDVFLKWGATPTPKRGRQQGKTKFRVWFHKDQLFPLNDVISVMAVAYIPGTNQFFKTEMKHLKIK